MAHGIRHSEIDRLKAEIQATGLADENRGTVEAELEATRERETQLRKQIDHLRDLVDSSRKSIGLDEGHFRSAISCALELVGTSPLKPLPASGNGDSVGPPRFDFPAIDQREGADPSWAETMDTLRAPRKRDQKPWEWRRVSPIRPVVFEDRGTLDDDVVHLHLEQRMVQRLLGRFTAQGFVHHDLGRACLAQTSDAIPRVILLGRLSLYGPGAARLHEELIPITARWSDPKIRKGPLTPYARDAETRTLSLLDESLLTPHGEAISENVAGQLQAAAPRDVQEMLMHLQTRGKEYEADAEAKLQARGEAEARAMRDILETQKKHIAATVDRQSKMDARQLRLEFGDDEREIWQLESNKRHWEKRLHTIDGELRSEPDRIRALYAVKARRIEPVGVVYLWPVTG